MSDVLVTVDSVGKKFCRSLKKSLWYGLKDLSHELVGAKGHHDSLRPDEFWANEDISFKLRRGETVGLIGHNGAGKTTLLRMLNGLIKPDKGHIEVRGRMQALIALGAGFNPILSGRENIYVNAAVLGYSKREIDDKLEQIIDFSGIREFIDSPVQNYSSGMAVRLGFAVAAHMDPDILLIDEVLAVGDVAFRKKCFTKIREFRSAGVGIILVTHDISQLYNLSDTAVLLNRGRVRIQGSLDEVIREYWQLDLEQQLAITKGNDEGVQTNGDASITEVVLRGNNGNIIAEVATGEKLIIEIHYQCHRPVNDPIFGVGLAVPGGTGSYLTGFNTKLSKYRTGQVDGVGMMAFQIDSFPLYPGAYELIVTIGDSYGGRYDSREGRSAIKLLVVHGQLGGGEFFAGHSWQLFSGSS
jgi:lipopolysaccharide transport system ATP-binding protein